MDSVSQRWRKKEGRGGEATLPQAIRCKRAMVVDAHGTGGRWQGGKESKLRTANFGQTGKIPVWRMTLAC